MKKHNRLLLHLVPVLLASPCILLGFLVRAAIYIIGGGICFGWCCMGKVENVMKKTEI